MEEQGERMEGLTDRIRAEADALHEGIVASGDALRAVSDDLGREMDGTRRLVSEQSESLRLLVTDIAAHNAKLADLSGAQGAMKKYNATRKLKKAAMGLMAKHRMAKLMEAGRALEAGGS